MRWLLAGCWALALIGLSEALSLTQKPRFYGVNSNRDLEIHCIASQHLSGTVRWFKAHVYNEDPEHRVEVEGERIGVYQRNQTHNSILYISKVQVEDSGVYFCRTDNMWGPGTQLIVLKVTDPNAKQRTTMKDVLIFLQGLLLAAAVTAVLLRERLVSEKTDLIYEEPETDHIYEGLAIERCDGGLYEELSPYAQADDAEAPWQ